MKIGLLFLVVTIAVQSFSQSQVTKLQKEDLPNNLVYKGELTEGLRWQDKKGDNIAILTRTEAIPNKDNYGSDRYLYAYHFLVDKNSVKQTWRVYEYVKECDVDMFLYFIPKSFAVTDLDKDGTAEVWMMYKVSCQGDAAPVPMKIIMYEGGQKFAARGNTRVGDLEGGNYEFDSAFNNGPSQFRHYADKLWRKHRVEKWEQ